ncbi:hypothetical protein FWF89_03410 [Candidatus Saccharibacteria bacterium]|nr:hypothetical protein [Candidatus Saccharibacteria bacterium]
MVIIVTLALLLLIFFLLRRNSGAALLAMIAGLAVYEMFGLDLAAQIHSWMPDWNQWVIEKVVYFVLILGFPMLLYTRTGRGGLHGILRLVHTIAVSIFLTMLLAGPLSEIFDFDDLSRDIANWIDSVRGIVIVIGLIGAYLDILFCRSEVS